ncbi:hypothetical protein M3J09_004874 [Ascochyta lentis]
MAGGGADGPSPLDRSTWNVLDTIRRLTYTNHIDCSNSLIR